MELREYLRATRRRWRLIFAMVVLTVAVTAGLTATVAPSYRSSTVLFVSTSATDNGPDAGANRLNSYIALLTGPRIATGVIKQLRLPLTVKQVQKKISAEVQPGTNLLVVTATDPSATRARDISTAASTRLIAVVRELEPTPVGATTPRVTITVAQEAVTAKAPQNLVRNIGFGAVLGLLLGAAGTAMRETLHKTVTTERDLQRYASLEAVGVITLNGVPGKRRRTRHPDGELAEAFRKLRTRLPFHPGPAGAAAPMSLLVTSSVAGEGTTAIACGLAIAMAETGSRVVLVDANLREPEVGSYLAMDSTRGLADVLAGTATVDAALHDWGHGRLRVLPAGFAVADPGELLATPALAQTIGALESRFDVVLVDAPPVLSAADAAVLSKLASGVLLVVRAGRTRTEHVERAVGILHGVGAHLVGGVLNALPKKLPGGTHWRRVEPPPPQWRPPEQPTALLSVPAADVRPPDQDATTVRGRARVIPPQPTARGRARVVIDGEAVDGSMLDGSMVDDAGLDPPAAGEPVDVEVIIDPVEPVEPVEPVVGVAAVPEVDPPPSGPPADQPQGVPERGTPEDGGPERGAAAS